MNKYERHLKKQLSNKKFIKSQLESNDLGLINDDDDFEEESDEIDHNDRKSASKKTTEAMRTQNGDQPKQLSSKAYLPESTRKDMYGGKYLNDRDRYHESDYDRECDKKRKSKKSKKTRTRNMLETSYSSGDDDYNPARPTNYGYEPKGYYDTP